MFVKWQAHVYDFEIMIWNHVSDSGKSNTPLVRIVIAWHCFKLLEIDNPRWLLSLREAKHENHSFIQNNLNRIDQGFDTLNDGNL